MALDKFLTALNFSLDLISQLLDLSRLQLDLLIVSFVILDQLRLLGPSDLFYRFSFQQLLFSFI